MAIKDRPERFGESVLEDAGSEAPLFEPQESVTPQPPEPLVLLVCGRADLAWGEWVQFQLRLAGRAAELRTIEFERTDLITALDRFQARAPFTVWFVLSSAHPDFFRHGWGEKGRIGAIRVAAVDLWEVVGGGPPLEVDLFGVGEAAARQRLLEALDRQGIPYIGPSSDDDWKPFPGPVFNIKPRAVSDLESKVDWLGFKPLVDGLYRLLQDEHTSLPLALAVTAPWGAGKSSVMLQLSERLVSADHGLTNQEPNRRWYTVRFDAWKYERSERLWAALAKAIYEQPQAEMSLLERVRFRVLLEKRRQGLLAFLTKGLAAPLVVALVGIATFLTQGNRSGSFLGGTIGVVLVFVASAGRYWGLLSNPFKRAIEGYASRPRYEEQLGFTSDADKDIQCMTKTLTRDENRALAVFVDDLDRCSTRSVVDVIEAINQIFNAPAAPERSRKAAVSDAGRRCVFVLGMDRELVAAAIDVTYKEVVAQLTTRGRLLGKDFGHSFLSKVVQISVTIPEPTEERMRKLLSEVTENASPFQEDNTTAYSTDTLASMQAKLREVPLKNPGDVAPASRALERELTSDDERQALLEAARLVRADLLNADSTEVVEAEFEVLRYLDRNPRQVKRFDNAFRLQLHVANATRLDSLDFDKDQLVALGKWVALRLRWPDLAEAIDDDPSLLKALEEFANRPDDPRQEAARDDMPRSRRRPRNPPAPEDERLTRWFSDRPLRPLLLEQSPTRRLSSLQDTFLNVA
jgi:hypothetical protein